MNPRSRLVTDRKGTSDVMIGLLIALLVGLMYLAGSYFLGQTAIAGGKELIDKANSCEAFSGVCLAYCTDQYPAITGGGKGLGCQNKTVCCQANRDDQIVAKYRVDGDFTFRPLDLKSVVRVPKGKKIFLQFWVENQKQAGWCTDFDWNQGNIDSVLGGDVTVDWKPIAPLTTPADVPKGSCPEGPSSKYYVIPADFIGSLPSPVFTVQLYVYAADPGAAGKDFYLKRFIAGFDAQ